jgi:hypothetical protein
MSALGHKQIICSATGDVRFTPNSDRKSRHVRRKVLSALPPKPDMAVQLGIPLWANSGPSRFVTKSAAWGESGLLFDPPYRADIVDPVLG